MEKMMADEETSRAASVQELNAIFAEPAPATNRFFVSMTSVGLRIAFGEDANGITHIRSATTMNPQDGIKLYKILQSTLKDIETKIDEMNAAEAAKAKGK